MSSSGSETCHICHLEQSAAGDVLIHRDDDWSITTIQDMPSMVMMFARRHDSGLAALSPSAAAAMGPLIKQAVAGMIEHGGYNSVSVVYLGDTSLHTHLLLAGRPKGDAPLVDPTPLRTRFATLKDVPGSRALAEALRVRLAGQPPA